MEMAEVGKEESGCCGYRTVLAVAGMLVVIGLLLPVSLSSFRSGRSECRQAEWGRRHLEMSIAAEEQQEYRKAERILEEAIKLDPDNTELRLAHMRVFVRRAAEQPQSVAEADLDTLDYALGVLAASGEGDGPYVGVARGRLRLREGKADEARKQIQDAVAAAPEYVYGHLALADLERSQGRLLEALAAFEKAAELAPDSLVALNNLGVQYVELNRAEDALKRFEKAIEIRDNVASRVNAADALVRLKRLDEAVKHLERAVELSRGAAEPMRRLAAAVLGLKDYARSAQLYARLLEVAPELLEARFGWAESLRHLGRAAEAADAYQTYLARAGEVPGEDAARIAAARKGLSWAISALPPAPAPGTGEVR
jgi:tetratricopeptide (TPR) repeat protein